jgi:Carboxypeptidase regulatory-like domain
MSTRSKLLALALTLAGLAAAQAPQSTGTIQGDLVDSTGGAAPGVKVRAVNQASGAARTAVSDAAGHFRLTGLPAGMYTLQLELEGFAPVHVEVFPVSVGQTVTHRIEMKPAHVIEKIEVKGQPDALEATATTAAATLGGDRIEEAPASNRNFLNFVLIAPGAASSAGSNAQRSLAGVRSAAADSGFTFSGMRGRNNSLSIDGVDNRDETTGGSRVAIGLEMVQEFRVSSSTTGAEFGGAAGGIVNVVTRAGTNLWHGDVTFFGQNERLNARNPESRWAARPRARRYQPGTSLNGPIRRDRTFFSYAIEQQWESDEEWSEGSNTPDAINRALAGSKFGGAAVRQVRSGLFPTSSRDTEFSFKLDHQISTAAQVSARYAFSRGKVDNGVEGADNFSDLSARGSSRTVDHSLVASWVHVPTPRLVNDLRFQLARRSVDLTPNSSGPMLEIPGVLTFGQSYRLNASRQEDHGEIVESLNYSAGRSQFNVGFNLHQVHLDARMANRFGGAYLFPALDDFLAGRPDVFFQAFGNPATSFSTLPIGFWLQDRWQPAAGLTLEAGFRYDRQRMPAGLPSSSDNLAPRLGLAWKPGRNSPYVLRAGFGLFHDRYPLAFLNDAIQKNGTAAFEQYAAGAAAAAAFDLAHGGALAAPLPGVKPSIYVADSHFPSTYSRKLTGGVERSLGVDTRLTLEYNWVRGFHLPRVRNSAITLPATYGLEQSARSAYQGGSISLNRRMRKELTYLLTYSLGRTHDDGSDFDEQPFLPGNVRADWARSRQSQVHRFSASAVFELPEEQLQWMPEPIREALHKVSFAPIFSTGSGRPINALDSTDALRTGAYPISARPFGLPRNPFLSPKTTTVDLRVMKTFPVHQNRAVLQAGFEAFNLANHTNAARVSQFYAAGSERLGSYGHEIETLNARQVQFMIQFEF